jgi:crotonobetainyl-CoA:carnitine CoA-transferase CaiB-like acyl-CoA transferase
MARHFFKKIDHPVVGSHPYCGAPFKATGTPWQSTRATLLGEHNEEVFRELLRPAGDGINHSALQRDERENDLPLAGVRIADLSHYWSGPHASRIMADLGAEVIRVEYAPRMCVMRGGRKENQMYNKHPRWHQVNRNKLLITLDLHDVKHREIFLDLVKTADVVLDNFRGGVMEKLGLGYKMLTGIKPDLIMLSMPAYGSSGPYASYAGVGASIEAVSGVQNLTAYDRHGEKRRIKEADVISGVTGACALLTALLARQRTGKGQHFDMSQMEALSHATMGEHLLEYVMNGAISPPKGNRHRYFAPQGCYACRGDDQWISLTIRSEEEWTRFCITLDHPEWQNDNRFATAKARQANHDLLDELIADWTSGYSKQQAMEILQNAAIPAGAVLDLSEVCSDPHLKARGFFTEAADGRPGLFPGLPFKLPRKKPIVRWRGGDLGQHNEYVICDLLHMPKDSIPVLNEDEIGTGFDPE